VRESLGAPSEFPDPVPPPVAWGKAMEKTAIGMFEMETSEAVMPAPFVEYEDWLGASPDGYVTDGKLIEVKCPWGIRKDGKPVFKLPQEQPHYVAQMQVQMFVTGYQACWFYQYTPYGTCNKLIHRDDDWLATNIPRLRQFHCEFLDELANNPDEHLQALRITIDTPAAMKMVNEYDQLTEALERAGERRKELLVEMVEMAGEKNAVFGGRKLTLTRKAGAVSYKSALDHYAPGADTSKFKGGESSFWGLK
jgi:putative phage-type endonuclease